MDNKTQQAAAYYEAMVNNYNMWQRGGVGDKKSRANAWNAAVGLIKLGMPNPWKVAATTGHEAAVPGANAVVTGVANPNGGDK